MVDQCERPESAEIVIFEEFKIVVYMNFIAFELEIIHEAARKQKGKLFYILGIVEIYLQEMKFVPVVAS
jgi:hypothetical protein